LQLVLHSLLEHSYPRLEAVDFIAHNMHPARPDRKPAESD